MAMIVPTPLVNVAPYSQIIGPDGRPATVTREMYSDNPNRIVALIVPSEQDAIINLINAGFQIDSMEVIDS